jgi:uncharacterized protein (TIGR03437 family)
MLNRSSGLSVAFLACGLGCAGQPAIQAILNGASYSGTLAPGMWATIFGTALAPSALVASSVPLPTQLNGVSVTVGGIPAPLIYVSPGQINAIIPFEVAISSTGGTVPVIVKTPTATSDTFNYFPLSKDAPALFTQNQGGTGAALAFDANFKPVTALGAGPIILYATGLGITSPPGSSASGGATSEPFNRVLDDLSVYVGETRATVAFAGLAPGFPGIFQINVTPKGPVSDRIYLQTGGWQSNIASVPMAAGSNVSNVTGSIDGLYPATGQNATVLGGSAFPVSTSLMFMAASFNVTFDILPNAKPFAVVATSEAGSSVINIDPVQNTYRAVVSVPLPATRVGDFSRWPSPLYDFFTCNPSSGCFPFPNNVVPVTRLDPIQAKAIALLPQPSASTSADGVNSSFVSSGSLASSHVVIGSSSLGALSNFGGFIQIAHGGITPRTTTFNLYVDGKLITTKNVNYTVN